MAMNKRKKTTAIVAGLTALALMLGGTFAWTSISQQARNEAIVDINPGGRLHDDFNGSNKDVYVENFGDDTTGVPIYARIRLDQYFEVGQDAGINKNEADRKVTQVLGTDINKVETWITYTPTLDENGSINFDALQANGNWTWDMGNGEDNLPYYMPTFNKNKDSLAADINGTYEGKTEGDIVHYDDYVVYVDAEGNPKTVAGTEVYDWDDENADEEPNPEITYDDTTPRDSANVYHKTKNDDGTDLTHTAKQIDSTATVITMQQWINDYNSQPGPYWVYDTDGWAYWAQAIEPGKTTGLLLDGINMSRVPDDNWYYGINVVGQFATAGDLSAFNSSKSDDETWTPAAETLLSVITNTDKIVISGDDTILPGGTTTYSAIRMALGNTAANQPAFRWTATAADGTAIDGVTMDETTGALTVDASVAPGTEITVTATVTDGTATAAEGDETALPPAGNMIVTVVGAAAVTADNGVTMYTFGGTTTETFTAAVDNASAGTFTWSVTDGSGNKPTDATITANAEDSTKATLTVGTNETADKLIVTATFKPTDSDTVYVGSYEVKSSEITTTDDMAATAYALVVPNDGEGTYDMVFVRSVDSVESGKNTYMGKLIEEYSIYNENSAPGTSSLSKKENITHASFANKIAPTSTEHLFSDFESLKTVDFNGNLDGSKLTNLSHMFYDCKSLEGSIDVSGLTLPESSSIDVRYMFGNCEALEEVMLFENVKISAIDSLFTSAESLKTITGLNTWDVSQVSDFGYTFFNLKKLTELNISKWVTSSATEMDCMFMYLPLSSIDLSNFDVSNVQNMYQMFRAAYGLTEITGAENWNVSKVENMGGTFANCYKLQLNCSEWVVDNVKVYTEFNENASGVTPPTWPTIPETTEP